MRRGPGRTSAWAQTSAKGGLGARLGLGVGLVLLLACLAALLLFFLAKDRPDWLGGREIDPSTASANASRPLDDGLEPDRPRLDDLLASFRRSRLPWLFWTSDGSFLCSDAAGDLLVGLAFHFSPTL